MKQIRKNVRRVLFCLCALFFLLVAYGAYSLTTSGSRWFSSSLNTFARSQRNNVIAGDLLDRSGVVLAATVDGQRVYHEDAQVRSAAVHITGDRNGNVTKSMDRVQAAYLYGFNMSFAERLRCILTGTPRKGDTVQLTVDSRLTAYVASIFPQDKAGAVVVMNYQTGEVLTEQSFPNFDPQASTVANRAMKPFINRAIDGLNAPGSTFKIVTAASAIENMADYATRAFHCDGVLQLGNRTVTDAGTNLEEGRITQHGDLNLLRAFQVSCNNTFATVALSLGDQKLRRTAEDFGFNDNFLFRDLIVENSSYPTENRTEGELAWTGAGQSALQVSPLHMCMIASAVANKGVMMEPRMLLKATSQQGAVRAEFSTRVYRRPLTESQADVLKDYMRAVVTGGTGTAAQIAGKKVCGKTGSAELDNQENTNAWFVGFLDEAASPYALAVVVEDAGGGGSVSAPIARQIFQWLLDHGYGG
ncbi:MAG: penicillin-binding protein 2 [Clostridia bacterium]|nr:penicillin-binding protein 2 [Clostridia bacterium]